MPLVPKVTCSFGYVVWGKDCLALVIMSVKRKKKKRKKKMKKKKKKKKRA